jgi:hypothetical protein
MMSIADLAPTRAIVFSIGHRPTADHESRSARTPCSVATESNLFAELF